ncbi:hypothetical protein Pmani_027393 [Petrolisthes manimaculis]|uniref:Uncharacterized protein n=1 Tax=Petrolisthes manimaculis TaxID=1843537 RepID=A0AAE1TVT0_9EUCA|nr:hypothetical protein Pmani_027393 [Petrolisthes manimaculis]
MYSMCIALKDAQKISDLRIKVQEEKSHFSFQLAQLTDNYNRLEKELEETKQVQKLSEGTENVAIKELKSRVEEKRLLLEKQNNEIQELKKPRPSTKRKCHLGNYFSALTKERDHLSENIRELSDKFIGIQEERVSELLEISAQRRIVP